MYKETREWYTENGGFSIFMKNIYKSAVVNSASLSPGSGLLSTSNYYSLSRLAHCCLYTATNRKNNRSMKYEYRIIDVPCQLTQRTA